MPVRASTSVVIYDGDCALCRAAAAWLRRHDLLWRLDLRPISSVTEVRGHRFARDDLEREMHVVSRDNTVHRGFRAWRVIAREVPVLRPLHPLLWLPGIAFAGDRVYRWVAGHRVLISRRLGLDRQAAGCGCGRSTGACDRP